LQALPEGRAAVVLLAIVDVDRHRDLIFEGDSSRSRFYRLDKEVRWDMLGKGVG
jgi:hypothetical protein